MYLCYVNLKAILAVHKMFLRKSKIKRSFLNLIFKFYFYFLKKIDCLTTST